MGAFGGVRPVILVISPSARPAGTSRTDAPSRPAPLPAAAGDAVVKSCYVQPLSSWPLSVTSPTSQVLLQDLHSSVHWLGFFYHQDFYS